MSCNGKCNIRYNLWTIDPCATKCIYCPDLFIDNWKVDCEMDVKIDTFNGDYLIYDSDEGRYLGDLFTTNGSNSKNSKSRKSTGFGIVDEIISLLVNIVFGPFNFEAGKMLRASLLINSILLNSEVWYY